MRAKRFLKWIADSPRSIVLDNQSFPLPNSDWEIEIGDLSIEAMSQAPCGEVFAHFDASAWSGTIPLAYTGTPILTVEAGTVCAAPFPALLGRQICEIGFGLNPRITACEERWGEKALGTAHIGLGVAADNDLIPPTHHHDLPIKIPRQSNISLMRRLQDGISVL